VNEGNGVPVVKGDCIIMPMSASIAVALLCRHDFPFGCATSRRGGRFWSFATGSMRQQRATVGVTRGLLGWRYLYILLIVCNVCHSLYYNLRLKVVSFGVRVHLHRSCTQSHRRLFAAKQNKSPLGNALFFRCSPNRFAVWAEQACESVL
jgi:hypothetical protein